VRECGPDCGILNILSSSEPGVKKIYISFLNHKSMISANIDCTTFRLARSFYCSVCDLFAESESSTNPHLSGKKHLAEMTNSVPTVSKYTDWIDSAPVPILTT
jgi:hypothetical protein